MGDASKGGKAHNLVPIQRGTVWLMGSRGELKSPIVFRCGCRSRRQEERSTQFRTELASVGRKIDQLLERIVDTTSDAVVDAYERKVKELEMRKAVLDERMANLCVQPRDFGDIIETRSTSSRTR